MSKSSDIRNAAWRRRIAHLLHFTQLRNLPTIVEHGIMPRSDLYQTDFMAMASAEGRLDGNDAAISVSITGANYRLFEGKRMRNATVPWVFLLLEPEILWKHECAFHRRNAAKKKERGETGYLGGPYAFELMFEDGSGPALFRGNSYRVETGIPDHLPTYSDAEVQVFGAIPPTLIKAAWVEKADFVEGVQALLDKLPGRKRAVVSGEFSHISNGYDHWLAPPIN